jgi:hypothetical protein
LASVWHTDTRISWCSEGTVPFDLTVGHASNDEFANAVVIPSVPYGDGQFLWNTTAEEGEPVGCAASAASTSIWYTYTPSRDERLEASTLWFHDLVVYEGAQWTELTQVACSDSRARATFMAAAGVTYYFQVEGRLHSRFRLRLVPDAPANDDRLQAMPVAALPFAHAQDITGATNEAEEPSTCRPIAGSVWYIHTAAASEHLIARNWSSSDVAVYAAGDAGSLLLVACDGRFSAEAGTTYYFQVGESPNAGEISFTLAVDRDRDADGVEDVDDNCPGLANEDQANVDGDGAGDACDEEGPALQLRSVSIRNRWDRPRALVRGELALFSQTFDPIASLHEFGLGVVISDAVAPRATLSFQRSQCHETRSVMTCRSDDDRSSFELRRVPETPGRYTFVIRAEAGDTSEPLAGPASVRITSGIDVWWTIERLGEASDCRIAASGLLCR